MPVGWVAAAVRDDVYLGAHPFLTKPGRDGWGRRDLPLAKAAAWWRILGVLGAMAA